MNRKDCGQLFLERHVHLFRCPHCAGAVWAQDAGILCAQGHRVDLSRKGTLSLTQLQGDPRYDAALFTARRSLYEQGFFDPLIEAIQPQVSGAAVCLDAGCGEGSLLERVLRGCETAIGLGVDLSAPAIAQASRYTAEARFFFRGNLAELPLREGQVDRLLNVLTPASYTEFRRVLKPGGLLLKVMPLPGHLGELRALAHKPYPRQDETQRLFEQACHTHWVREITYTLPVARENFPALLTMTPLDTERIEGVCPEITFSFLLCAGEPR